MAKIHLSSFRGANDTDSCASLDALTQSNQIVVSNDTKDFFDGNPCDLGRAVYNTLEYTAGLHTQIPVLDPTDNCIKRNAKPASIVYNETTLKPWINESIDIRTIGGAVNTVCLAELTIPTFAVDTSIFAYWHVLWSASVDQAIKWYPHFGDPGGGNNYLNWPKIASRWRNTTGRYLSTSYERVLPFAAGRVGQTLAVVADFPVGGQVYANVIAYAMKKV